MTADLSRRAERLLRALASQPGLWDDRGRRILRIAAAGSLKRMVVPAEIEASLLERGLVAASADGLELSAEGRAWVARMSGEELAYRLQHGDVRRFSESAADAGRLVDEAESPLRWLSRRKGPDGQPLVDGAEFEAGERLRLDFTRAGMMPSVTSNWRGIVATGGRMSRADLSDAALAARDRVARALSALGPELSGIVLDVCCFLKGLEAVEAERGWPQRSAKVVLKMSLSALARHYGIGASPPAPAVACGIGARPTTARPSVGDSDGTAAQLLEDASACCASALMRRIIELTPLERCGVRWSRKPSLVNVASASVAMIVSGVRPENMAMTRATRPRTMWASESPVKVSTCSPPTIASFVSSHTWLAQPRTLVRSLCASAGSGSRVRPSSIR